MKVRDAKDNLVQASNRGHLKSDSRPIELEISCRLRVSTEDYI